MELTNQYRNERKNAYLGTENAIDRRMDELAESAAKSRKSATEFARAKDSITLVREEPEEYVPDEELYSPEDMKALMRQMYGEEEE